MAETLITLMATNNSLLDLLGQADVILSETRAVAFDGAAMIGHLRRLKFRELLAWWLRERGRRTA